MTNMLEDGKHETNPKQKQHLISLIPLEQKQSIPSDSWGVHRQVVLAVVIEEELASVIIQVVLWFKRKFFVRSSQSDPWCFLGILQQPGLAWL